MTAPNLRVVPRDELSEQTARQRRFLGMANSEPTELTFFVEGRIWIAQVTNAAEHVRALRQAEQMRGFNGAYQLVNGPLVPELFARYEPNRVVRAWNGRANDTNIQSVRALFLDCDPVRIKGISATDAEKAAALEVTDRVVALLATKVPAEAIGRGDSGNGYFVLVALEPVEPSVALTTRISALLNALQRKFGTPTVKIDCAVANPARLMPAAGTWKRKGWDAPERPHRRTCFTCADVVERVAVEVLA